MPWSRASKSLDRDRSRTNPEKKVLRRALESGDQDSGAIAVAIGNGKGAPVTTTQGWVGRPWLSWIEPIALAVLLALGASPRFSHAIDSLRGSGAEANGDDSDGDQAAARGYYEGLIEATAPPEGTSRRPETVKNRDDDESAAPPGWVRFEDAGLVEDDPGFLVWRLRSNLDVAWNDSTFRTNPQGFRGPAIEPSKPPGTFRVVVLGSSNTLAQGANDEDGYIRLLERWLAGHAGPGRRVEVVNLAVSGYGPTQRLHRLMTEVEALSPDWILSDASALDLYLEELHLRASVRHDHPIPYEFVRRALAKAGVTPTDSADDFGRKLRPVHEAILNGTYAGLAAQARRLGAPLTVIVLPRVDARKDNSRMLGRIADAAHRHGLITLDVSNAFDRGDLNDYRLGSWDGHPDARGHRRIFDRLLQEIHDAGGLPALTGGRLTKGRVTASRHP